MTTLTRTDRVMEERYRFTIEDGPVGSEFYGVAKFVTVEITHSSKDGNSVTVNINGGYGATYGLPKPYPNFDACDELSRSLSILELPADFLEILEDTYTNHCMFSSDVHFTESEMKEILGNIKYTLSSIVISMKYES